MQTPMRHRDGSQDGRAGAAGPRARRLSSAAALVADIVLVALGAALIVFSGRFSALDAGVAILVLVAAVAAAAWRLVQAFRGRVEHGVLRQPLRRDLRPHLLQFLNYTLLAALILIAGAFGTFTNLPLYTSILGLPRISGQQATVAVQLAALALAALARRDPGWLLFHCGGSGASRLVMLSFSSG